MNLFLAILFFGIGAVGAFFCQWLCRMVGDRDRRRSKIAAGIMSLLGMVELARYFAGQ
jgi:hypothetical protein